MGRPSAGTAQLYQYSYDARGRRTQREQSGGYLWNYGYDEKNQLASAVKVNNTSSTVPGYDWSYDYDDIGNRVTVTDSGAESDYTVNVVNQYTQREVPRLMRFRGLAHPDAVVTLTEDAVTSGALLQVDRLSGEAFWLGEADYEGAAGADDRRAADFTIEGTLAGAGHGGSNAVAESNVSGLLKPNPESFTYDDDGNLTRDAYWDYSWDAENRLIAMEHRADLESFFDLNGLERQRLEFMYDSQSRRVQKEVFYRDTINNAWVSQESHRFLYDGWNPLVELVSTGGLYTVERTYLWGLDIAEQAGSPTRGGPVGTQAGGVGGLLAIYSENAETTLLPTYDGHGSVMTLVDAGSGAHVADYEYGPFGELLRATGPLADENPFGYSTKYTDAEGGLVYYGYRYYVPESGRWLNRDPIEERGGVNLYGFVGNNGENYIDILGLSKIFKTDREAADAALIAAWKEWVKGIKKESESHYDDFKTAFDAGKLKDLMHNEKWAESIDAIRTEYGGLLFCGNTSSHQDSVYTYTGPVSGLKGMAAIDVTKAGNPDISGKWKQIGSYHTHPIFNEHVGNVGPFSTRGDNGGDVLSTPFGHTNYMIEPNLDSYSYTVPEVPEEIDESHGSPFDIKMSGSYEIRGNLYEKALQK